MKKHSFVLLVFISSLCYGQDFRIVDKKIEFPIATVGNHVAWTEEEKTKLIANYEQSKSTKPYIVVVPVVTETVVASTVCRNTTDFKDAVKGNKDDLISLVAKEDALRTAYIDAGDISKAADSKSRKSWLIYLYNKP